MRVEVADLGTLSLRLKDLLGPVRRVKKKTWAHSRGQKDSSYTFRTFPNLKV